MQVAPKLGQLNNISLKHCIYLSYLQYLPSITYLNQFKVDVTYFGSHLSEPSWWREAKGVQLHCRREGVRSEMVL